MPLRAPYLLELRQRPRERADWFAVAAEAARRVGDRSNEGNALGNLGLAYTALGQPQKAIEFHQQYLAITREIGHRSGAGRMATSGQSLDQLASVMTRLPQVLINVPDVDKNRAATDPRLSAAVREAEAELGDSGRVLLRPSGTESLVRVMVEAENYEAANETAHRLADVVKTSLAL